MEAKLTRLTHKIVIHLHILAENLLFTVLAAGGQSENLDTISYMFPSQKARFT